MKLKVAYCIKCNILGILHLTSKSPLYIGRYRPLFKLHQACYVQKWSINGVYSWQRYWYYYCLWIVWSYHWQEHQFHLVVLTIKVFYHAVLGATRIQYHIAVSRGLFLITFRDPSLKTCSQTKTPLRPMQKASGSTLFYQCLCTLPAPWLWYYLHQSKLLWSQGSRSFSGSCWHYKVVIYN